MEDAVVLHAADELDSVSDPRNIDKRPVDEAPTERLADLPVARHGPVAAQDTQALLPSRADGSWGVLVGLKLSSTLDQQNTPGQHKWASSARLEQGRPSGNLSKGLRGARVRAMEPHGPIGSKRHHTGVRCRIDAPRSHTRIERPGIAATGR